MEIVGAPTFEFLVAVQKLHNHEFARLSINSRSVAMISCFETSERLNFRLRVNLLSGGRKWKTKPFGRPGPFFSSFILRRSSRVRPECLISSIIRDIASRFG